ncbi:hypothetical protein MJO28_003234 [Puccinia striiformis f. sp. tritici]|uniref:Uncharacterized protein n=1 Tax=Puccinia striiformis f. sp. tritici TaxID=168172 RepID=A0ACC0ETA0_9BASI|nr:hypothetical protein MJO28_003234 [Puccinia striiformis f. sp. tritici]KAI7965199.1 hypothetical protein MJO29_003297 [Puccinia striiformis f. sp. tritici]
MAGHPVVCDGQEAVWSAGGWSTGEGEGLADWLKLGRNTLKTIPLKTDFIKKLQRETHQTTNLPWMIDLKEKENYMEASFIQFRQPTHPLGIVLCTGRTWNDNAECPSSRTGTHLTLDAIPTRYSSRTEIRFASPRLRFRTSASGRQLPTSGF